MARDMKPLLAFLQRLHKLISASPFAQDTEHHMILHRLGHQLYPSNHVQGTSVRCSQLSGSIQGVPACDCLCAKTACSQSVLPRRLHLSKTAQSNDSTERCRCIKNACMPSIRCFSTSLDHPRISAACPVCSGSTQVPCGACKASGRLTKSGYHARNPVNASKLVGKVIGKHLLFQACM